MISSHFYFIVEATWRENKFINFFKSRTKISRWLKMDFWRLTFGWPVFSFMPLNCQNPLNTSPSPTQKSCCFSSKLSYFELIIN